MPKSISTVLCINTWDITAIFHRGELTRELIAYVQKTNLGELIEENKHNYYPFTSKQRNFSSPFSMSLEIVFDRAAVFQLFRKRKKKKAVKVMVVMYISNRC